MSVYGSFGDFDDEEDSFPQPYVYRKSHVIPRSDHPRAGSFDLGQISAELTRGGYDDRVEVADETWPYLRVSLRGSDDEPDTIVMDARQVDALIEVLSGWRCRVNDELLQSELGHDEVRGA